MSTKKKTRLPRGGGGSGSDVGMGRALVVGGAISAASLHAAFFVAKKVYQESSILLKHFVFSKNRDSQFVTLDMDMLKKLRYPMIKWNPYTENIMLLTSVGIFTIEFPALNVYHFCYGSQEGTICRFLLPTNMFHLFKDVSNQQYAYVHGSGDSSHENVTFDTVLINRTDLLLYDLLLHMILNDFHTYLSSKPTTDILFLGMIESLILYTTQESQVGERNGFFKKIMNYGTPSGKKFESSKNILRAWFTKNDQFITNARYKVFSDLNGGYYITKPTTQNMEGIINIGIFSKIEKISFYLDKTAKNEGIVSDSMYKRYVGALRYSIDP